MQLVLATAVLAGCGRRPDTADKPASDTAGVRLANPAFSTLWGIAPALAAPGTHIAAIRAACDERLPQSPWSRFVAAVAGAFDAPGRYKALACSAPRFRGRFGWRRETRG